MRTLILSLLVGALALAAAPAAAQDSPQDLFRRGEAAYSQGDYESAVQFWKRAYELDTQPLLQYNLSQAYERLGDLDKAIAALEIFIASAGPGTAHTAEARARLSAIRERMSRTSIRITGGPDGATVLIDGTDRGRLPHPDPFQVEPGSHRVVVQHEGYSEFTSNVVVAASRSVDVPVDMQRRSEAAVATNAPPREEEESSGGIPTASVILWAAGGAGIVTGVILGTIAMSKADDAPASEGDDADSARSLALGADIAFGVGIAAGVTGTALLFVMQGQERSPHVRISPTLSPSYAGATVQGSF